MVQDSGREAGGVKRPESEGRAYVFRLPGAPHMNNMHASCHDQSQYQSIALAPSITIAPLSTRRRARLVTLRVSMVPLMAWIFRRTLRRMSNDGA